MALLSAPSSSILGQDPSMLYFDRLVATGSTEPDLLAPSLFRFECRCPVGEIYLQEVVHFSLCYSFHFQVSVRTLSFLTFQWFW